MENIVIQLGSLCRFCMHDLWLLSQLHGSERWHQTTGVGMAYTASILILHYMLLPHLTVLQLPVCITGDGDSHPREIIYILSHFHFVSLWSFFLIPMPMALLCSVIVHCPCPKLLSLKLKNLKYYKIKSLTCHFSIYLKP